MASETRHGAPSQVNNLSNPPTGSSAPQQAAPSDASARLNELLQEIRVSPKKSAVTPDTSWRESAAVPPLVVPNGPGQMIANPPVNQARPNFPQTCLGVLSDGSHILDHVAKLHAHIDVLGPTLYDRCEIGKAATLDTAEQIKTKLDELTMSMEKRFESTRTEMINTIKTTSSRAAEQDNAIHTELEKLYNYIKSDIADVLAKQAKKTGDLETTVKALQTTVHDLQKAVDKQTQAQSQYLPNYLNGSKNMYSSPQPLPNHHSQPNFGYDVAVANNDVGRDMSHRGMAPVADANSNGRYATAYNGYGNANNGGYGQPWHNQGRPATANRDSAGKDESYVVPPGGYYNPGPLQARSGNAGTGYANNGSYNTSYYSSGLSEGNYPYGQNGK